MSNKPAIWKAVSYGTGALAALATRRGLTAVSQARRAEPPPDGPGTLAAPLPEALTWAIAVGTGVAVMRLLAIRSAAKVWEVATNEPPPADA